MISQILILSLSLGLAYPATLDFKDKSMVEFHRMSQDAAEECRVANNVEKGDWEKMAVQRKVPDDRNIMCMTACFLEKFGSIQSDGKLNWDVITTWNNKEHGSKGAKYVEICRPKIKEDGVERCQLAKDLLECYFIEGEKIGLFEKTR